jgi:hypothetical protein
MTHIRMIAAAATAIAVAFALSPAMGRSCDGGNSSTRVEHTRCAEEQAASTEQAAAPVKLDQFMDTWKPVTVSKHRGKRSKAAARRRATREAAAESKSKAAAAKSEVAEAKPVPAVTEPAVTETAPPAETASTLAASPENPAETDGVAVTSFTEANELDAAAGQIRVAAFNEVNDIDLAAPPPPVPAQTVGQSAASEEAPADNSWIAKLLLAAAGTIAVAGATRFLVV